jgi:CheY-like chemotaxis protein
MSTQASILVADDDELIRMAIRQRLEASGYRVICVENGLQCVEQYEAARPFALVILDHEMPVMSGEEAFHRIRALDPEAKFIVSSGSHKARQFESLADGNAVWLPKPYGPSDLLRQVKAVLGA